MACDLFTSRLGEPRNQKCCALRLLSSRRRPERPYRRAPRRTLARPRDGARSGRDGCPGQRLRDHAHGRLVEVARGCSRTRPGSTGARTWSRFKSPKMRPLSRPHAVPRGRRTAYHRRYPAEAISPGGRF